MFQYNGRLKKKKSWVLFLSPFDAYVRSFLYLLYTLIKLYYTKALSDQALSLALDWILLLQSPRIPASFWGSATTFHSDQHQFFWKFLRWDSCTLSGGPKCLPGSRFYLTILRTPAEPQVTLDVAGRTEFLTDTWAPALYDLTSRPPLWPWLYCDGSWWTAKGKMVYVSSCYGLWSIITTHSFLYMPDCLVPLLGRDLLNKLAAT